MTLEIGRFGWLDLTVDDADGVRDFYQAVVGWDISEIDMDGYDDYCLHPPGGGDPVAGICHRKGANSNMPSQWMIYVGVADLDFSMSECERHGGTVLVRDRDLGSYGRMSVIRDPSGAVLALMQPVDRR